MDDAIATADKDADGIRQNAAVGHHNAQRRVVGELAEVEHVDRPGLVTPRSKLVVGQQVVLFTAERATALAFVHAHPTIRRCHQGEVVRAVSIEIGERHERIPLNLHASKDIDLVQVEPGQHEDSFEAMAQHEHAILLSRSVSAHHHVRGVDRREGQCIHLKTSLWCLLLRADRLLLMQDGLASQPHVPVPLNAEHRHARRIRRHIGPRQRIPGWIRQGFHQHNDAPIAHHRDVHRGRAEGNAPLCPAGPGCARSCEQQRC